MAISDTGITSVELINTFEQWRSKTNQIIAKNNIKTAHIQFS